MTNKRQFTVTYEIPEDESNDRIDQIISKGVLSVSKPYRVIKLDGRFVTLEPMAVPVVYKLYGEQNG